MNNTYNIFGLYIQSIIPFPASPICSLPSEFVPDIIIEYGDTPGQLANPQKKGLRFQAAPREFLLCVDSVARYYVQEGRRITIQPEPGMDEESIRIFLMGSVMGALLHQRNILVLHAGAIAVNGQSVIFSGHSGIGKSTLTAGFHQRGYAFLADDVCAIAIIAGKPAVIPGFPSLKLWADVLKKLNIDKDQLESVRWIQGLEKYFLLAKPGHDQPVPLKSMFTMGSSNKNNIEIAALYGADKIDPFINNTYRMSFLDGLGGKKNHFRQCAVVAAQTSVYRIVRPNKGFLLNELMDMLEERF
jgi:hypothetical protein